jgi:hypothetical protein
MRFAVLDFHWALNGVCQQSDEVNSGRNSGIPRKMTHRFVLLISMDTPGKRRI